MPLSLDDFNDKQVDLTDFAPDPRQSKVRLNERSAAQLAAGKTLIEGPSKDRYEKVKNDLIDPEGRKNFILENEAIRSSMWDETKQTLVGMIGDSNVPYETKENTYNAVMFGDMMNNLSTSNLRRLAESALAAENGNDETDSEEWSRADSLSLMDEAIGFKKEMTQRINALHLEQGFLGTAVDVGELLVPFVEWIQTTRLRNAVAPDSHAPLMGDMRVAIRDKLKTYSIDERRTVVEGIIQAVQDNDQVVLPDGNDLIALQALQDMLVEDDYTNADKWMDNVFGLLDFIGLGFIGRGAKLAGEGERGARAASSAALDGEILDAEKVAEEASTNSLRISDTPIEGSATEVTSIDTAPTKLLESPEALNARIARQEATKTDVVPTSPSQIVKEHNPSEAKKINRIVDNDESGEAAKALYGTNRDEALAHDTLPEMERPDGSVKNKVDLGINHITTEPKEFTKARTTTSTIILNDSELNKVYQKVTAGFKRILGMESDPAQFAVRNNPDGTLGIRAFYRPTNSGFKSASEALEYAKFAFRDKAITDTDITVMEKTAKGWMPVNIADDEAKRVLSESIKSTGKEVSKEVKPAAEYAFTLNHNYSLSPADIDEVDLLATGNVVSKVLDRVESQILASLGQGSIVQHMFDVQSLIHKQIANAAAVAVDRSTGFRKLYLGAVHEFQQKYRKLDKAEKVKVKRYMEDANLNDIPYDAVKLRADGFSKQAIDTLSEWKKATDYLWYGDNGDFVVSLRNKGYKAFVHPSTDTKLYGRPMGRRNFSGGESFFDPVENKIVKPGPQNLDKLYESNGTIMELRSPVQVDGQWVDRIIARDSVESGYVREIFNDEKVLNYRNGYYPVYYDANYFIQVKIKKADGTTSFKTVAGATTTKERDTYIKAIKAKHGLADSEVTFVKSVSNNVKSEKIFGENSWDLVSSGGRSTQRLRGERLMDAGADLDESRMANIMDPVEALTRSINGLSRRIALRNQIDIMKKRWILNYGEYLDLPKDARFKSTMPARPSDVRGKPGADPNMVADARTNYNYLYALENGYINQLDEAWKAGMNIAAESFGRLGAGKAEKLLFAAGNVQPNKAMNRMAFRLFLGSNPLRQAIVQRGQMATLPFITPKHIHEVMNDYLQLTAVRSGVSKDPKYLKIYQELLDQGILDSIDEHTFIRREMIEMADPNMAQKMLKAATFPLDYMQKVGFDWAEQDIIISTWLAFRREALAAGKDITSQRVKDEIIGQTRAYTLMMNRAGESPYSQNTLSMPAQFLTFQHKAMLQAVTNKSLSPKQRALFAGYSILMFGINGAVWGSLINELWMDSTAPSDVKDKINQGLLGLSLNWAATQMTGEKQAVDWGDLAPVQAYGTGNALIALLSSDMAEVIASSPSVSLLFGNNPKLADAFNTAVKYFVPPLDYKEPELQTRSIDVITAAANIFSGYSSAFKAKYANATGVKVSSSGNVTDDDVTKFEAAMTAFGMRTIDETGRSKLYVEMGSKSVQKDDVVKWYDELKRHLNRRYDNPAEEQLNVAILREAWRVFGDERPRVMELIQKEIERDAKGGDYIVFKAITSKMGFIPQSDIMEMVNSLPPGVARDRIMDFINTYNSLDNGENNGN